MGFFDTLILVSIMSPVAILVIREIMWASLFDKKYKAYRLLAKARTQERMLVEKLRQQEVVVKACERDLNYEQMMLISSLSAFQDSEAVAWNRC